MSLRRKNGKTAKQEEIRSWFIIIIIIINKFLNIYKPNLLKGKIMKLNSIKLNLK